MARSSAAKVRPDVRGPSIHGPGIPGSSGSKNRPTAEPRAELDQGHQSSTSVHPAEPPVEPEDAQITGTSRSLQRRVLGLNVEDRQPHPETAAGQHATGSFTGENGNRKKKS